MKQKGHSDNFGGSRWFTAQLEDWRVRCYPSFLLQKESPRRNIFALSVELHAMPQQDVQWTRSFNACTLTGTIEVFSTHHGHWCLIRARKSNLLYYNYQTANVLFRVHFETLWWYHYLSYLSRDSLDSKVNMVKISSWK